MKNGGPGRKKTLSTQTINFENISEVCDIVSQLSANTNLHSNLLRLSLHILKVITPISNNLETVLELLLDLNFSPKATNGLLHLTYLVLQKQKLDCIHEEIDQNLVHKTYSSILEVCDPSVKNSVNQVSRGFRKYLFNVSQENQEPIFAHLGSIVNKGIHECALARKSDYTLKELLNESPQTFYDSVDSRLTSFIYNAVGLSKM